MQEIKRIHLAKVPYEIELDASVELENYLSGIKQALGENVDIFTEIEFRITELLAERGIKKNGIITITDIAAVRAKLGEPQVFVDDSDSAVSESNGPAIGMSEVDNEQAKSSSTNFATGADPNRRCGPRRLYRDTDHALLGGICAGIAAYFNIDVVLVRIILVCVTIIPTFGTLIVPYIILWIIIPAAKTASEKLQMHGEAVDFESLKAQAVGAKDEFKTNMEKLGQSVKGEAKNWSESVKNSVKTKPYDGDVSSTDDSRAAGAPWSYSADARRNYEKEWAKYEARMERLAAKKESMIESKYAQKEKAIEEKYARKQAEYERRSQARWPFALRVISTVIGVFVLISAISLTVAIVTYGVGVIFSDHTALGRTVLQIVMLCGLICLNVSLFSLVSGLFTHYFSKRKVMSILGNFVPALVLITIAMCATLAVLGPTHSFTEFNHYLFLDDFNNMFSIHSDSEIVHFFR